MLGLVPTDLVRRASRTCVAYRGDRADGEGRARTLIESFNGKFRDECLNESWFINLDDVRSKVEAYRIDHDEVRPHSSLDDKAPNDFTRSLTGLAYSAVQ